MLCIVEIAMLVFGIIALVKGEIKFSATKVVRGFPARIIGLILAAPLPSMFVLGFVVAFVRVVQGEEPEAVQASIQGTAIFLEIAVMIACGLLAVGLGFVLGRDPRQDVPPAFGDAAAMYLPPKPPSDNPYEPPTNPFRDR